MYRTRCLMLKKSSFAFFVVEKIKQLLNLRAIAVADVKVVLSFMSTYR